MPQQISSFERFVTFHQKQIKMNKRVSFRYLPSFIVDILQKKSFQTNFSLESHIHDKTQNYIKFESHWMENGFYVWCIEPVNNMKLIFMFTVVVSHLSTCNQKGANIFYSLWFHWSEDPVSRQPLLGFHQYPLDKQRR